MDLLQQPLTVLKGVGPQLAEKFKRVHISCVQDLLFHLPFRYQDRTRITPVGSLRSGQYALIEAEVVKQQISFGKKRRLEVELADTSGYITMSLFHFNATQRKRLQIGTRLRCFGEVRFYNKRLQMVHPEYQIVGEQSAQVDETLTPIYPATDGTSQKVLRQLMQQALILCQQQTVMPDYLPAALLKDQRHTLQAALSYCHQPPPDADQTLLEEGAHPAQQRLALEELLAHHLSLRQTRAHMKQKTAPALACEPALLQAFYQALPFTLTGAQQRVSETIFQDLRKPEPMLRLVQGDVGSGKTVVAAASMLAAVSQNYQAVLMAPTEILAEQHFRNLKQYFHDLQVTPVLLTSRMPSKTKKQVLADIAQGQAKVIIGTHALIQDSVMFYQLGLVVIDEQHRFGVEQRLRLQNKNQITDEMPHQLIMTATPIPRTLAMTVYADLDYSVIDELPPGRKPIKTIAIVNTRRDEVINKMRDVCAKGQQVYWVCTLIEESEALACQAAQDTCEKLQAALPDLNVGLIHGRLKSDEKDARMQAFKAGELHILVATTVIEVGVDVPNATLMVIENPERLGLAQLHQLRGRVGRGAQDSHCVLLYQTPLSYQAKQRLQVMRESQDGFIIAEKDLQIRGSGEWLGTRQSGETHLKVANLLRDQALISEVKALADQFLQEQADFVTPLIRRWLGAKINYGRV